MRHFHYLLIISFIPIFMSFTSDEENMNLYKQSLQFHYSDVDTDTAYIIKCFDIELPQRIGKIVIVYIDNNAINILKDHNSLYVVKVMPLQVNKGDIEVVLVDFVLEETNGEVFMSNTGSEVFTYRYSKKEKKYKLINRLRNKV